MINRTPETILIIENKENWLKLESDYFDHNGFVVAKASTLSEGKERINSGAKQDLVLINLNLESEGDGEGVDILEALQENWPALPRIVITAKTINQPVAFGNKYDVDEIVYKYEEDPRSFDLRGLRTRVSEILESHKFQVICNQQHSVVPRYTLHCYQNNALKDYKGLQLFEFVIENPLDKDLDAVIEFEQNQYIQHTRHPCKLKKRESNKCYCSPIFSAQVGAGFNIAVNMKLLVGRQSIWEAGYTYIIRPDDILTILLKEGAEGDIWTRFLIVTCITPKSEKILELSNQAIMKWEENHPGQKWNSSEYTGKDAMDITEILRELLKDKLVPTRLKFTNISDNTKSVNHDMHLPDEVIQGGAANCVSYSQIYASVLESLGIQPLLLFMPGHVLVGWKTHRSGTRSYAFSPENFTHLEKNTVFIESMKTADGVPFSEMMRSGKDGFDQAKKLHLSGKAVYLLDVVDMRSKEFAAYAGR